MLSLRDAALAARCIERRGQPHQRRDADEDRAEDTEDLPPNFRRHGFLGDAMHQGVSRDRRRRGEQQRHAEPQDRRALSKTGPA